MKIQHGQVDRITGPLVSARWPGARRPGRPAHNHTLAISPEGRYRGSFLVEHELVYVVQTDKGQETLDPEEFARKYGWKNDANRVKLVP